MDLERFLKAQEQDYNIALEEIKNGKKISHWMWYIFPQIKGLGFSPTAQYFAIENKAEAEAYLNHPVLYKRLIEISEELLKLDSNDAYDIFGFPDCLKLKSSMTLFYKVSNNRVFKDVIDKFYNGEMDEATIDILEID